jgi:hypothetical protein|tara:strand:+ start:33 stop:512 length:480 start_codon:yes stop_codon:yes gene_type:complete
MKEKKFHEVTEKELINLEKPHSYKIFDYYSNKIPINIVGKLEEKKTDKIELSEDEIQKLFEKTNLNVGENTDFGFYEKELIKEKNYNGLAELLKKKQYFKKMDQFMIYTYARKLCGKSLKQKDYEKINSDINYLEKKMEKNDLNRITFTRNQNFTLKFE